MGCCVCLYKVRRTIRGNGQRYISTHVKPGRVKLHSGLQRQGREARFLGQRTLNLYLQYTRHPALSFPHSIPTSCREKSVSACDAMFPPNSHLRLLCCPVLSALSCLFYQGSRPRCLHLSKSVPPHRCAPCPLMQGPCYMPFVQCTHGGLEVQNAGEPQSPEATTEHDMPRL